MGLATLSHTAGIGIVGSTHGDREAANLGDGDLVLGGSQRDLGGGSCTGEDEDGNEDANDVFHNGIPLKLYSQKKICLDKANGVTIGYIME